VTLTLAVCPSAIVCDAGCDVIVGVHVTVTMADTLSTLLPQRLKTLTQYELVVVGDTVRLAPVPPVAGVAVFPVLPTYH